MYRRSPHGTWEVGAEWATGTEEQTSAVNALSANSALRPEEGASSRVAVL